MNSRRALIYASLAVAALMIAAVGAADGARATAANALLDDCCPSGSAIALADISVRLQEPPGPAVITSGKSSMSPSAPVSRFVRESSGSDQAVDVDSGPTVFTASATMDDAEAYGRQALFGPGVYLSRYSISAAGYPEDQVVGYNGHQWAGYIQGSAPAGMDVMDVVEAWGLMIIGTAAIGAAFRAARGNSRDDSVES